MRPGPPTGPFQSLALLLMIATGAVLAASALVFAQDKSHVGHAHGRGDDGVVLTMPSQDAFSATQEIVRLLEADPDTDWSKIDLVAFREYLIDMNEVTLKATAVDSAIDNGLQIDVTGSGHTLLAIQRMLPAHAREHNGLSDWRPNTEALANRIRMTVISHTAAAIAISAVSDSSA